MRHFILLAATVLAASTLFAQHSTIPAVSHPAPSPTITSVHTATPTVTGVHTPAPSAIHGNASSSSTIRTTSTLHTTKAVSPTITNRKELSKSVSQPNAERRGLFSFLRKHETVKSDRDKCKGRHCSTNNNTLASTNPRVAHEPLQTHLGCTIVPTTNPAIPCNPIAPCCP